MSKKYEINKDGRIVALRSFGNVKEGDIGGFVESESNLSQDGNCWISGDAEVSGNAIISGNTIISGNAIISGDAIIY